MLKIVTVVGARPQFIKAAVLRELFESSPDIKEILIHTGQHYDVSMSDIFFSDLNIKPAEYKLGINTGGPGQTTGRMMEEIEKVLQIEKPDAMLVYGDTNSTLAGALSAVKLHIPVIHVEAGLRSFNKRMPEEINRIMTDHVSDYLFCSTETGVTNLQNENISKNIFHVGDIMYDATLKAIRDFGSNVVVPGVDLSKDNLAICTIHRAENTDAPNILKSIFDYLNEQTHLYEIILPLHPRTEKALKEHSVDVGNIRIISPVGYPQMQALLAASKIAFTDSGGLQKEAYFHKVPCVTLRGETEWVELVDAGWNRLWTSEEFAQPRLLVEEYGSGDTGEKIVKYIKEYIKN